MNWLINLKVSTKLIGGFLIIALITAIVGTIGIRSTGQINTMAFVMYDRDVQGLRHAADARVNLLSAERAIRNAMLAPTTEIRGQHMQAMPDFLNKTKSDLDKATSKFSTEQGKALVVEARNALLLYEAGLSKVAAVVQTEALGQTQGSVAMLSGEVRPLANAAGDLLLKLIERKQTDADTLDGQAEALYKAEFMTLLVLTIISVLSAGIIGTVITRVLTHQLGGEPRDVASIASAIASGNLITHIDMSKAAKGSIIEAINLMQVSLRKVVAAVRTGSDNIASGSSQIAIGNADLSQRTEEQAANITETAAAMEELSSTVKSNAEVAQQAAQLASSASTAAVKGGEVVNGVVTTMDEINTSSKKIVEIIDVIDGIAFQTNILALNAAVEAARAGEQGRGFAVVASEVRSLAQRSASAAKDIKDLIDDSVGKVSQGTQLVHDAGTAMSGIVTQVQHVTDLINDISAATTEQTTGLSQINEAVVQLSDVTQQNAALVEQSAAAAESLNDQARHLVDVVRVFKLDDGDFSVQSTPVLDRSHSSSQPVRQARKIAHSVKRPASGAQLPLGAAMAVAGSSAGVNDDWEEF
ncbi:MCP four helix bundle domain-containing protein [Alcaligenaceae bacterium]|nr:MCP four helix bundle domain-containing protein [Alcaligenaceae bacterium]